MLLKASFFYFFSVKLIFCKLATWWQSPSKVFVIWMTSTSITHVLWFSFINFASTLMAPQMLNPTKLYLIVIAISIVNNIRIIIMSIIIIVITKITNKINRIKNKTSPKYKKWENPVRSVRPTNWLLDDYAHVDLRPSKIHKRCQWTVNITSAIGLSCVYFYAYLLC